MEVLLNIAAVALWIAAAAFGSGHALVAGCVCAVGGALVGELQKLRHLIDDRGRAAQAPPRL